MTEPDLSAAAETAAEVAVDWGVTLGPPFPLSRFSYVAPAGPDAVLKVTLPGDDESEHEADALELWAGDGAVRLLRSDRERRALLLERAFPGSDLAALPESDATAVAVAGRAADALGDGAAIPAGAARSSRSPRRRPRGAGAR